MSEAIELTWNARHVYSPVSNCVTLLMSKPSARMRNFEALAVKAKEKETKRERAKREKHDKRLSESRENYKSNGGKGERRKQRGSKLCLINIGRTHPPR